MLSAGVAAPAAVQQRVPTTEAEVLRQFQARIDEYMVLHSRLEKEAPPLKTADDPEAIRASQKGLADKDSRGTAEPGAGSDLHPRDADDFSTAASRAAAGTKWRGTGASHQGRCAVPDSVTRQHGVSGWMAALVRVAAELILAALAEAASRIWRTVRRETR